MFPSPAPDNAYLAEHIQLLCTSLKTLTGRQLISASGTSGEIAEKLFHAPFVVLSHNTDPDPVLTYMNLAGLELFEMTWEKMLVTPSCSTAEASAREERERLLYRVAADGYIDDYAGVRISGGGRRFRIEKATVWNLLNRQCALIGQAATFDSWVFLE